MLLSTFDDLRIFGHQMAKVKTSPEVGGQAVRSVAVSEKNVAATDTCKYTLLFVGDSMLEGLSPRLAAYAEENGHSLYTVIWYGSTTEKWGATHKLRAYIEKFKPGYIVVCLGGNELFCAMWNAAVRRWSIPSLPISVDCHLSGSVLQTGSQTRASTA